MTRNARVRKKRCRAGCTARAACTSALLHAGVIGVLLLAAASAEARVGIRDLGQGGVTTTTPDSTSTTAPSETTTSVPQGTTSLPADTTTTVVDGTSTTSSSTTSTTVPGSGVCNQIIDFEDFEEGEIVFNVHGEEADGVHVHGSNPLIGDETNAAVIFDSSCPGGCSGNDEDLGTPNEDFGGPGEGAGGEDGGTAENTEALGNVLIVADHLDDDDGDGNVDDPNDQAHQEVTFSFDFSDEGGAVVIHGLTVIDVESDEGTPGVALFEDAEGDSLAQIAIEATGNNGVARVEFPRVEGATLMEVTLFGSGAIDDIEYELDCDDRDECTEDSCGERGCRNEPISGCGGGSTTTTSLGGTTTTTLGGTTTTVDGGTTTTVDGGTTTTLDGGTTTTLGGGTTTTLGGGTTTTLGGGTTTTLDGGTTTTLGGGTTTTLGGATTTTLAGGSTTTLPGTAACGDADGDGNVTARDALLALKAAVGAQHACARSTCDVDASAAVTAADALRVLQAAVGNDVNLTCA